MTIPKDEILALLKQMPDRVDVEDLIYRLYLREKLAAAEEDVAAGRTFSPEEARGRAAEWQK
jgi:hypothetical protein